MKIKFLSQYADWNIIVYSLGWLNVSSDLPVSTDNKDMAGIMAMIHGLDLILNAFGGCCRNRIPNPLSLPDDLWRC